MNTRLHSVIVLVSVALLLLSGMPVSAGDGARQTEPVTLYDVTQRDDPQSLTVFDPQSNNTLYLETENLFLGLTNVDPVSGKIIPALARDWSVSDDGRVWTFYLRDDVPWVRWDPAAGEAAILRMVTAHDVAYGIARTCDPRTGAAYVSLIDGLIVGCSALADRPIQEVSDDDIR